MMKNEAIGAYEAAAVMGVHFSRPQRMVELGLISCKILSGEGGREFSVYSLRECDENFRAYEEELSKSVGGRPRTRVDARHDVLRMLADKQRPVIMMDDAISTHEAAEILGVWHTVISRIGERGEIVGRVLWSDRASTSRLWVWSRKSCEEYAAKVRSMEKEGTRIGRPRTSAPRKKTANK